MQTDIAPVRNHIRVSVTIRYLNFQNRSHQRRLEYATDSANTVYDTAKQLLGELWKDRKPLRLMSVALTNVSREPAVQQLSLFDDTGTQAEREKAERLDKAISAIRNKFGYEAIQRGTLIGTEFQAGRRFRDKSDSEREKDS